MKVIRAHIKFGGPTIRALQACGACLRDIMRRYSASRGSDYSLPVFCLAPTQTQNQESVSVPTYEETGQGAQGVHSPGVPRLQRTASVQLAALADPELVVHPVGTARNPQRTITYDRQGNVLLERG